ncbi:MAG: PBSX family phage terminase large subunit [Clostridia bacterium]|nr:PBSX family phage terminase large subunit [Clostridia bacterium]
MNFKPFSEKQLKVMCWWHSDSPYAHKDAIICDGAVRSGKTLCMSISFVLWAFYRFCDTNFALCGKTVTSLKRNMVTPLIPVLKELGFKCTLKQSANLLVLKKGDRTNRFYLFGGKDESSAALIQGITLGGVLLDEVALMPRSFVEQALARCSVEGSKFWFNCNPDFPGHWFYTEWIKAANKKNCLYLHFTMKDNPSLSPEIIKRYSSLYSGTFYQRFVEGKWVAAQGLVYPMFDKSCIVKPQNTPADSYFISCDYGTVNPSSFGLWGVFGNVYIRLNEYYYDSKKEGISRTDEEHYSELCRLAGQKVIDAVVCDPSAASFITVIRQHGRFKVIPAKNDVVNGIRRVQDMLKSGRLKICDCCTDSIREFSLYRWANNQNGDAVRKENDHAMDDIRYMVSTVAEGLGGGFYAIAATRR